MKKFLIVLVLVSTFNCVKDESVPIVFTRTTFLNLDVSDEIYQRDAVYAFGASNNEDDDVTDIFVVFEENAEDFKFYETGVADVNPNDLSNYLFKEFQPSIILDNGLLQYKRRSDDPQWIIVTYRIDGIIKLSSPILVKSNTQPTVYSNTIDVSQDSSLNPTFNWEAIATENHTFFFESMHRIADEELLSLTFTDDSNFTYFDLSNVTLNLSQLTPPELEFGNNYRFEVMQIDLDNWVNTMYQADFIIE